MPFNQSINGATVILAELEIKNNPDLAVVDSNRVRGGTHAVSSLTQRNSIPDTLRKSNITRCYVADTDTFYWLKGGIANSNWTEEVANGGSNTVLGGLSKKNLNQTALNTTADGQLACDTGILGTPQGAVIVTVAGKVVRTGDAVKTLDCYFSRDSGTTALEVDALAIGDRLFWNGSIAGYQLGSGDNAKISFIYVESVGSPSQGNSNEVVITQSIPLAVWPITHNQVYAYPDVIVLDDNNQTLDCIYEYIDATHLNIIFDEPVSGKAILH